MLAATVFWGCSSDSGDGGAGGAATGSGGAGPATWGDGDCGACVKDACATQVNGCLADPECPAYLECLEACPTTEAGDADPECQAACPRGTGTESRRAAAALDACRDPGAGAACEACGTAPRVDVPPFEELNQTCGASDDTNACFACQDENCCETLAACDAEPDCVAYKDCVREGGDLYSCGVEHPRGVEVAAPGYVCAEYHCAVGMPSCDKGERDACFTCLYDTCGAEWAALVRTRDGFLSFWCVAECAVGDNACDQACRDLYPAAEDAELQLGECLVAACSEEC